MKKVIFVVLVDEVLDAGMYSDYIRQVAVVIRSYKGVYVARSEKIVPFSGDAPKRAIVIAFDSMDEARKCFSSEEYGKIAHLRENSTKSRAFFIENN